VILPIFNNQSDLFFFFFFLGGDITPNSLILLIRLAVFDGVLSEFGEEVILTEC
jgi:hypothetical protein